jgi:hypothetical protein
MTGDGSRDSSMECQNIWMGYEVTHNLIFFAFLHPALSPGFIVRHALHIYTRLHMFMPPHPHILSTSCILQLRHHPRSDAATARNGTENIVVQLFEMQSATTHRLVSIYLNFWSLYACLWVLSSYTTITHLVGEAMSCNFTTPYI